VLLTSEVNSPAVAPGQAVDKDSLEVVDAPPYQRLDHHSPAVGMSSQEVAHIQVEEAHSQVVHPYHNHNPAVGMGAHTLEVELQAGRHSLVGRRNSLDEVEGNHMDSVEGNHTEAVRLVEVCLPSLFPHQKLRCHLEVEDIL